MAKVNVNELYQPKTNVQSLTRCPESGVLYTDGMQEAALRFNLMWLIPLIGANRVLGSFQVYILFRYQDKLFMLRGFDGDEQPIHFQMIANCEAECDIVVLWMEDGCLMLPSEY